MDIYIDKKGLIEFLRRWIKEIRKDNDCGDSIHNISFDNMSIYEILLKQNVILNLNESICDNDTASIEDVGMNDARYNYLPIFNSELDKIDDVAHNDLQKQIEVFLKRTKENFRQHETSIFNNESSLSIINDETPKAGHNPLSKIDLNDVLNELKKFFFVEYVKDSSNVMFSLNKTFFTRGYNQWEGDKANPRESYKEGKGIELPLDNEKDIIIVDPYFFQSKSEKFGENEMAFIKAICKDKRIERNIVVFFQNCVCSEWLEVFSSQFKNEFPLCKLSFIGVKNNSVLHDRFVVSNYRLIFSGHSFVQYFKNDKFSAHGSIGLFVGSVADGNNENVMSSAINYLQTEILNTKNHFVYGDCISNLLIIKDEKSNSNIWISKTKTNEILNVYKEGTIVKLDWDDDNECIHWGENFILDCKEDHVKFKGCEVRICNIRPNRDYPKRSKYQWIGFPFRI